MDKVLIVVDMKNDFISGVLGSEAAKSVVNPIKEKIKEYIKRGCSVLFTMDTHEAVSDGRDSSVESEKIPTHCVRGTEGWEISEELVEFAQKRIEKPTFMSLTLEENIIDDNSTIELCGVCTDICVISNALYLRARYPSRKIIIDPSCCAGTSRDNHEAALDVMRSCLIEVL